MPLTDLRVSILGYGAVPFGTQVQGEAVDRLVGAYLDAGGNFFDTAHCYCFWVADGSGASERALGACVRRLGVRDRVVIATKGGHPAVEPSYPRPDAFISPGMIAADLDDSLTRLGMDYVDLYYLHRDDARVTPGEIIEMLNVEVARGRVRALGASNWRTERIAAANAHAAAHGLQGFAISQVQWSLAVSSLAPAADPTMRTLTPADMAWHAATGMPVAAYSATACGFFAGSTHSAAAAFDTPGNRERRQRAHQLASALGCTPNQVALAYLLHQPFPVIPLTGTANPEHLQDALGAVRVTLTPEQMRWLADGP